MSNGLYLIICSGQTKTSHVLLTQLPHVLYTLQTLTCCPFLVFALPLPPVVSVLQLPLCKTRSHLAFTTLPLPIPSAAFLKLTASSRLLAPPSDSPKCLRFGLWLTLCTLNIALLTYLHNTANFPSGVSCLDQSIYIVTHCSTTVTHCLTQSALLYYKLLRGRYNL